MATLCLYGGFTGISYQQGMIYERGLYVPAASLLILINIFIYPLYQLLSILTTIRQSKTI